MNVCRCFCTMFNRCGDQWGKLKTAVKFAERRAPKEKQEQKPKTGKGRRVSIKGNRIKILDDYEVTPEENNDITARASIELKNKKVTFVQEPDIGFFWVFLTDVTRWITSPLISSIVIFGFSFWFTRIHVDRFKECKLTTEFRLDDLEIKQQWRNSTTRVIYETKCTMQQNPILSNLGNIMVFFLTIALGAGLDKYKETLRMYEEITGDIKAMGMLMVHLTFDHEKYDAVIVEEDRYGNPTKRVLKFKTRVDTVYRKIRYLLASLGPTVKNTLAGGEYAVRTAKSRFGSLNCFKCKPFKLVDPFKWVDPFTAISDRKYYIVRTDRGICDGFLLPQTYELRNYWKDSIVKIKTIEKVLDQCDEKKKRVADPDEVNEEKKEAKNHYGDPVEARAIMFKELGGIDIDHEIQYALYSKIEDIHDKTNMDAFECTMTVLLDEIMRLFENGLGFGEDEGSAVVSAAIERWNAIYATWGTMASLKTFSEPFAVNLFRIVLVGLYAYFVPIGYLKYVGTDVEEWIRWYVAGEMFIFCLMWWLAFAVRNPFKNSYVIRDVNALAYSTQYQVLNLMANQREFDNKDYGTNSMFGYITKDESEAEKKKRLEREMENWNPYSVFDDRKTSEEKALEKLIEAVNNRNITVKNDNSELKDIISRAFKTMQEQTQLTLNELKEIIKSSMTEIKEYDRDALAKELELIMQILKTEKGVIVGGYGNDKQKKEDAKRRREAENRKKNSRIKLRSRIRLASLNSQRSSYLAF